MNQKGFTLVEILIVVAILGIIVTVVSMTFSNNPQEKARDALRKGDIDRIADAYEAEVSASDKYRPLGNGGLFQGKIPSPPEGGTYQGLLTEEAEGYIVCAALEKGKDLNCLENSENTNCYCRKSKNYIGGGGGGGGPTPQPSTNPWGKAIVVAGVGGWPDVEELAKVNYNNSLDISGNNLTVEAWIKPALPTQFGSHFRIVDTTFRLTMAPTVNGDNVTYHYYFDVTTQPNFCNQTVVYSGNNSQPWNAAFHKTVSKEEFQTWKHVAGVMQNGNFHIYENGVKLNTYNAGQTSVCNQGRNLLIGAGDIRSGSYPLYDFFQGAIDEVRGSSVARYTSNFTPQKTPFTQDGNTLFLYHFDDNADDAGPHNLDGYLLGDVDYIDSAIPTD